MRALILPLSAACVLILASKAHADQAFDQMMKNLNSQHFNPNNQQLQQQYQNYQQNNPQIGPQINPSPNPGGPTIGAAPSGQQFCPTNPVTVQRWDPQDCGIDAEQEGEGGVVVPNQGVFQCDCHNNCVFTGCAEPP